MSGHYEIRIKCSFSLKDILISRLVNLGYEGFLEKKTVFYAYIPENTFDHSGLKRLIRSYNIKGQQIDYLVKFLPEKNWNENWEKDYTPVVINGKYLIRAKFHQIDEENLKTFTISSGMAFGTGHHETTELMITLMEKIDFHHKKVLDFGAGTGILSIFAEHFGAEIIIALDNNHTAISVLNENIKINNCKNISVLEGGLESLSNEHFDIVLANIDRNTLISSMDKLNDLANSNGALIISGFYINDLKALEKSIEKYNFKLNLCLDKNDWTACIFKKNRK